MTKAELHSIPKFTELFEDVRFRALLIHLSRNPLARHTAVPNDTILVNNEGKFQGWFDCLDAIEALKNPPEGKKEVIRSAPYTAVQKATSNG